MNSSVFVLADIPLRSPRELFIFVMTSYAYWMEESQLMFTLLLETNSLVSALLSQDQQDRADAVMVNNQLSSIGDNVHDESDDDEDIPPDRMLEDLVVEARKRAARTVNLPPDTRRRRLVSWLQRTGHDWNTVMRVLDELNLGV